MRIVRLTNRAEPVLLAGAVLATLLACKALGKKDDGSGASATPSPAAVTPTGPITLNWEQPYKLTVAGSKAEGTFFATKDADKPPLKLQASFHDFPKGTKIKIGSDESTVGDGGFWSTLVDIKPAILKQSLDDLKGAIDLGLELSIQVPGAPLATTKLQKLEVKDAVRAALIKARDGGVSFGPGDDPPPKPRGVAVISSYSDIDFIGSAKSLTEVDWVVIAEDQKEPRGRKSCSFKEGPSTLKMFDADTLVVDRRSGAKVAEQVLKASDECPMFALVSKGDNSVKNSVASKDVVAFARTQLGKGGPAPNGAPESNAAAESTRQSKR